MKRLFAILIAVILVMQVLLGCKTANTNFSDEGTNTESTEQGSNSSTNTGEGEEAMNIEEMKKVLRLPNRAVDVVLDTDAYNEIDDQFAIAYMLANDDRIKCQAIYAAPFLNNRSESAKDGMEKSYNELVHILTLCKREDMIEKSYKGSESFLVDEKTPVISDAANDLVRRAKSYSRENPLYVIAIGAITNIASALLIDPSIKDNIVIVWLGGNARHWVNTAEFNMIQDIAAARVVFSSGAPLVQLPCEGVVSSFRISETEIDKYLVGKNELCDYLASNVKAYYGSKEGAWTAVIWDVTAVAWLINDGGRYMLDRYEGPIMPEYNRHYSYPDKEGVMKYVFHIKRDELANDLFTKLANMQ